jgi:hypothetical protein
MSKHLKGIRLSLSACLLAAAAAGQAAASDGTPAAAPAAPAAAAPARELTDATCGDYLDLVEQVSAESKDTSATASSDAQDDLVSVMLWLHGYLSGREGIDGKLRPLTQDWLAQSVGVLANACAVDETRRVVDVVTEIK